MNDEEYVKSICPTAWVTFNTDEQRFKVYHRVNGVAVALSSSWETRSMAWAEAARLLKDRVARNNEIVV